VVRQLAEDSSRRVTVSAVPRHPAGLVGMVEEVVEASSATLRAERQRQVEVEVGMAEHRVVGMGEPVRQAVEADTRTAIRNDLAIKHLSAPTYHLVVRVELCSASWGISCRPRKVKYVQYNLLNQSAGDGVCNMWQRSERKGARFAPAQLRSTGGEGDKKFEEAQ